MTRETEWRREWDVLRAERVRARHEWRTAADGLAARARDPLGVGGLVRDHPVAATGIGAAAAALLVKLFVGRASKRRHGASTDDDGAARTASPFSKILRDTAVSFAVPWLLRAAKEKFGWDLGSSAEPRPSRERETAEEPDAASSRR